MNDLPLLFLLKWKRIYQCHASFRGWLRTWIESHALCVCVSEGIESVLQSVWFATVQVWKWWSSLKCRTLLTQHTGAHYQDAFYRGSGKNNHLPYAYHRSHQSCHSCSIVNNWLFHFLSTFLLFLAAAFFSDWVWDGFCCMLNIQ